MPSSQVSTQSLLERLRSQFDAGEPSRIEDYLRESESISPSFLADLVALKLAHRIRKGDSATAREYLIRFPQVSDPETALCWIGIEYRTLREMGADVSAEAFRERYPEWSALPQWGSFVTLLDAAMRDAETCTTPPRTPEASPKQSPDAVQRWIETLLDPSPHGGDLGLFGDYRVQGILGKGGMGVVLKAFEQKLQRPVALKLILPQAASRDGATERFFREARAAAGLMHQRVVPIFAVGEVKGTPYLAMPLLPGQSLGDLLKHRRKLPPSEALRIVREAAEGLAAAHTRGLTHRDIKPDNIWLEETPDGAHVRLLDFGLARGGTAETITEEGGISGTPQYMAPEQAEGKHPDPRADLFSLGCVLYESLSGARPFEGGTVITILNKLANHHPPTLRSLDASIPTDMSILTERLLEKDPAKRVASAQQLVESIRSLESNSPAYASRTAATIVKQPEPREYPTLATVHPKPRMSRWWLAVPLVVLVGVGLLLLPGKNEVAEVSKEKSKEIESKEALRVKAFRIQHFAKINEKQAVDKGLVIGDGSFAAKFGDQLEFDIEFTRPVYAYLIALRPDGVMEMIHPDSEDMPPAKSDRIRYPKSEKVGEVRYGLTDGLGLWGFAVAASEEPLPSFASWGEKKPGYWRSYPSGKGQVYNFDGSTVEMRLPPGTLRGKDEAALDASSSFERALKTLRQKSTAGLVSGWAFVVE